MQPETRLNVREKGMFPREEGAVRRGLRGPPTGRELSRIVSMRHS